jgi:hypothetical protein
MTTGNPRRNVMVFGASRRILDECIAALADLGYTAQGTNDFFTEITDRFDVASIDLVSLGGLVSADRKAEIREQVGAINPRAIVIDSLAGIAGLVAAQVEEAFTADQQRPGRAPTYAPGDRSIRLTLAEPAAVKVILWWRVSLMPPEPRSDSLVLLDDLLTAGDHTIPVPSGIPALTETTSGPRQAPWFATVHAGPATYNLTIPAGQ